MQLFFKHLDLREIEGRLDGSRKPSARGKMYWDTEPGKTDMIIRLVALIAKEFWEKDPAKIIRIQDIEDHPNFPKIGGWAFNAYIPAAIKRLARMNQVKIDFDRDGVLISPGSAWIET